MLVWLLACEATMPSLLWTCQDFESVFVWSTQNQVNFFRVNICQGDILGMRDGILSQRPQPRPVVSWREVGFPIDPLVCPIA